MGDDKLMKTVIWRYGILIFVGFLFIVIGWAIDPNGRKPAAQPKQIPPERKTILNATMTPVEGAPDGTYILEYSNGKKEILHPDGTRMPLVPDDHPHEK